MTRTSLEIRYLMIGRKQTILHTRKDLRGNCSRDCTLPSALLLLKNDSSDRGYCIGPSTMVTDAGALVNATLRISV